MVSSTNRNKVNVKEGRHIYFNVFKNDFRQICGHTFLDKYAQNIRNLPNLSLRMVSSLNVLRKLFLQLIRKLNRQTLKILFFIRELP